MLSPLPSYLEEWGNDSVLDGLLGELEQESDFDEIYNSALKETGETELALYFKNQLTDAFSLRESDVTVRVLLDEENETYRVSEIYITLGGEAVLSDPHQMIAMAEELFQCPCVVLYD